MKSTVPEPSCRNGFQVLLFSSFVVTVMNLVNDKENKKGKFPNLFQGIKGIARGEAPKVTYGIHLFIHSLILFQIKHFLKHISHARCLNHKDTLLIHREIMKMLISYAKLFTAGETWK